MKYRITNQKQLRAEFWRTFPELPRRRITNYAGNGKMHCTDTRCATTFPPLTLHGAIADACRDLSVFLAYGRA